MTKTENKSNKCLFLFAEKGKYGIKDYLKPLKPLYNGVGWFIEERYHNEVKQISVQANMRLVEWPLHDESFDEFKRKHKAEFFQVKSIEKRLAIDGLKATLGIYELDNSNLKHGEQRTNLESIPNGKKLIEYLEEYDRLQDQLKRIEDEDKISNISIIHNAPAILPMNDRIQSLNEMLKLYRGKKYLGLRVKTIPELNEKLKGLRKLILLAAAPNVGKTALTIQLAQEMLLLESDACLVYVSLEMTSDEIFTRMNLYLSGLDFDTFVLGKEQIENETGIQPLFSEIELKKIEESTRKLEKIGDRLQIIDSSICPIINAEIIIDYVDRLKKETGCGRTIVIIDYLQVWPTPIGARFSSDIEADKWRIGEVKKIRDAVNKVNQDPVIVISEARKPSSSSESWGGDLSDVMGSARGTYTPDVVMLFSQIQPKAIKKIWIEEKLTMISPGEEHKDISDENEKAGLAIISFLAHHGMAICKLKVPKCRDGMKRFNVLIMFHFNKNTFTEINWKDIKELINRENIEDKKKFNLFSE